MTALSAPARPALGDNGPVRDFGPITRTDIVRYAAASGDFNPIHHDEPFARSAGLDSVMSIGMFQGGLLGTYLTDWLGTAFLRRFRLRFSTRVWPGDVLRCSGTVTGVTPQPQGTQVSVSLQCVRQTGEVAVHARAEYLWDRS